MPKRRPNPRLAKIHRTYTVEEIARLYGIHRNTVRDWIKRGLPTCDSRRPLLVLGSNLADYIRARRMASKRPCLPGQLYCMKCRAPKYAAGRMADYTPLTSNQGNLVAICPDCDRLMYRRVSLAKLSVIQAEIEVCMTKAERHIVEPSVVCVNHDFNTEPGDHANSQPK